MSEVLSEPVLVLNKHYVALRVVDLKRAMTLLVRGTAEALDVEGENRFESYDFETWEALSQYRAEFEPQRGDWLRCVGRNLLIPAVVRLTGFARFHRGPMRLSRRNIYARDRNTCQYCGAKRPTSKLNLDHVTPSSRGGKTAWDNLVCSCIDCNSRKGNRTPEEAGMKLIQAPRRPEHPARLFPMRHDSWKHFVDAAYWNVELKD